MQKFNSKKFIKSLKESYDAIPYHDGDNAAKKLVVDAIKSTECSLDDTLSFISNELKLSTTLTDKEWLGLVKKGLKIGGSIGKNLAVCQELLKGKLTNQEMFSVAVACCGKNIESFKAEHSIDRYGWRKAVETLIKSGSGKKESKKEETVVAVKKSAAKGAHSKSISITLINTETGEKRTWDSYSACDMAFGKKRGTTSQLVSGKVKRINGVWRLFKAEDESLIPAKKVVEKKEVKQSRNRAVLQIKMNKQGKEKVVRRFKSITEASKTTGIAHSSISKNANGVYQSAGGFLWRYEEIAA